MKDLNFAQITIVGTGLLGGSVGLALRRAGYEGKIVGTGSRPATLRAALELKCIDSAVESFYDSLVGSDLILLAAPVSKIPQLIAEMPSRIKVSAVVTDVGSTKARIVATAEKVLDNAHFVGSHPMAGAEKTGPQSSRADLFDEKPVIVTPTARTDPDALSKVEGFWRALNMRVHRMGPAEHDQLVAVISHLPHAVAVLLVQLASKRGALPVASTGFADTTRLAAGDPDLWADIFLDNRESVIAALEEWKGMQEQFIKLLQTSNRHELLSLLKETQITRQNWRDRPKGA